MKNENVFKPLNVESKSFLKENGIIVPTGATKNVQG